MMQVCMFFCQYAFISYCLQWKFRYVRAKLIKTRLPAFMWLIPVKMHQCDARGCFGIAKFLNNQTYFIMLLYQNVLNMDLVSMKYVDMFWINFVILCTYVHNYSPLIHMLHITTLPSICWNKHCCFFTNDFLPFFHSISSSFVIQLLLCSFILPWNRLTEEERRRWDKNYVCGFASCGLMQ